MEKQWKQWENLFFGLQNHCRWWESHEIKRCLLLGRKAMINLGSILKSRDITLPAKICLVKAMVFPVVTYGCESWTVKKAECRRIDAFELWCWKTLESPLNCKEIQPIHPKGDQSWVFIGRTDVEAETPVLWLLDVKNWLIWKDPNAGKDWRRRRRGRWRIRWLGGITNSQGLLKLMSIESMMPSNHLILHCPLLLPPSIFLSIRVFSNESVLHQMTKVLEFQLQ